MDRPPDTASRRPPLRDVVVIRLVRLAFLCLGLLVLFAIRNGGQAPTRPRPGAPEGRPAGGITATFSIVAADPENGVIGAAVASKYPAVGKVVPYARAGVGA